jgi:predicted amino acid racemase
VDSPYLTIDLDKIEHNARAITGLCRAHGISVTGVTKAVFGHPEVAKAMIRGRVASLGESRLDSIRRMKEAGIGVPCMLLRLPPLSGTDAVVDSADVSLNSEISVLGGLAEAARQHGGVHDVIVMVDLGDLREGVWPEDLAALVRAASQLRGIRIAGIGTNLSCFGGVIPSEASMTRLVELASEAEQALGHPLDWISGANSSGLELIAAGRMPARVNHARIGEAILLGRETIRRTAWPGTVQDAFTLHAEVLECKRKPSVPVGERGEDAFGNLLQFDDRGLRTRALLNVGREDVRIAGLTPLEPGVAILGASSGYLVADVTDAPRGIKVGDELAFAPDHGALIAAMTSKSVRKCAARAGQPLKDRKDP